MSSQIICSYLDYMLLGKAPKIRCHISCIFLFRHILLIILFISLEHTMNKVTNGHHNADEAELDRSVGEHFLSEAVKVILEEAVHKATDVKQKVP